MSINKNTNNGKSENVKWKRKKKGWHRIKDSILSIFLPFPQENGVLCIVFAVSFFSKR